MNGLVTFGLLILAAILLYIVYLGLLVVAVVDVAVGTLTNKRVHRHGPKTKD